MFYVYVILNRIKGKVYIGQTIDVERRIKRHNKELPNKSKSYTSKSPGGWSLIYKEEFTSRAEAIKREKELKSYQGRKFIKNMIPR